MKKQLLTGAFLLASFLAVQAQETIYSQNFENFDEVYPEDEDAPSWLSIDSDGDGEVFGGYFSNASITSLGFSGQVLGSPNFTVEGTGATAVAVPTVGSDNTALSVFFNFGIPELADIENMIVSFKLASAQVTDVPSSSPYEVYVVTSTDMATVDSNASFTTMLNGKTPVKSGSVTDIETIYADFSSAAGQIAGVAVRNRNADETGLAYLFMDDFTILTGTLSQDKHLASSFSLYPNPANDVVNIGNTENILINSATIIDLNGRTVKTVKFSGVADAQVNISDLSAGVYMVTVSSDKGSITKKIVKN